MPITGGVFTTLWQWVVDATTYPNMEPNRFDMYLNDMATAVNTAVFKDGTNVPTGNLPMAGFVHTNVGNSTARNQYSTVNQVQDARYTYAPDTGAANAYVVTLTPAPTAYVAGQRFTFKVANANTGASTLNVNGLGAKPIVKGLSTALASGDIPANAMVTALYDGTNFVIQGLTILADKSVTLAKQADGTANTLQGWNAAGVASSIAVGNALTDDGSTLAVATANQAQAAAGTATNVVMTPLASAQREQAVRQSLATEYIIANGSTSLLMPLDPNFDEFEVLFENVTQTGSNTFRLFYHDGSSNITTTSSQFLAAQGGGSGANSSTGQIFQVTLAPLGIHLLKGTVFNRASAQKSTFFNGGLQEGTGLDATIMSSVTPSGPKYANLNFVLSAGTFTGGRVYVRKIYRS